MSARSTTTAATLAAGIVLALLLPACATASRRAPSARPDVTRAPVDAGPEAGPPPPAMPSLEALAARGPVDAPSMREALRSSEPGARTLAAGTSDTCFRAIVAIPAAGKAWFEDGARAPRGEPAALGLDRLGTAAAAHLVPPRGPACARKGETLRLVIEPPAPARVVVWQSP